MRHFILLATTTMLAACGGGSGAGPQTISSTPPPATGSGSGGTPVTTHTFANPTEAKTYVGVGGVHVYDYLTDERQCCNQQGETYSGNSSTPRSSSISIAYDPGDAIYTLTVQDAQAGAQTNTRFQDPASRTDFGGALEPQWGTTRFDNANVAYLQAGDGNPRSPYGESGSGLVDPGDNQTPPNGTAGSAYQATTLFVLRPGSETQYVTYAGYVRNAVNFGTIVNGDEEEFESNTWHLERGAFAYGQTTAPDNVPKTGTGSYSGSMIASMIYNPTIDGADGAGNPTLVLPSYFQWIEGTAQLAVNFTNSSFEAAMQGEVHAPHIDRFSGPETTIIEAGAAFAAAGRGDINLVNFGGFKGAINAASLTNPDGTRRDIAIEGSAINGSFYGPSAEEVGGGFRIVGGNPDERIDILGTFVGKK